MNICGKAIQNPKIDDRVTDLARMFYISKYVCASQSSRNHNYRSFQNLRGRKFNEFRMIAYVNSASCSNHSPQRDKNK